MAHKHVSIDQYAYESGMREYNSGLKMAFAVAVVFFVVAIDLPLISLMTLVFMSLLIIKKGKVKLHDYIDLLGVPLAFIILSSIAIMINFGNTEQETLINIPIFATRMFITSSNLWLSLSTAIKALGAISALYMMTLSTPMGEILNVMRKIHIPDLIIELMHLIYRYIFILWEINHRQKEAARARLGYCDYKTSMKTFGSEMANLFVVSMKKSNEYYDAMESRGYDGNGRFWSEEYRVVTSQVIDIVIYVVLAIAMTVISKLYL